MELNVLKQLYSFTMTSQPLAVSTPPAAITPEPTQPAQPGPDLQATPCTIDAGDRQVQVLLTLDLPRVVLFGGLLSGEECDEMIAAAKAHGMKRSNVISDNGGEELHPARTSEGMYFQRGDSALIQRIETRIARLLRWPVDNGEGLQILHYRPGAEYRPHFDYFLPESPSTAKHTVHGGQRVGTLILYLNDVEAGGATIFPNVALSIMPRKGHALFFGYDRPAPETRTLHGGAPVVRGDKWIATKWLRERAYVNGHMPDPQV